MSQTKLPAFTSGTAASFNSSYFSDGFVGWERYGDLVVVSIRDLVVSKSLVHGTVIATGLPKPRKMQRVNLTQWSINMGASMRVVLDTDGKLKVHYSENKAGGNQYYGQIIYVAAD